MRLHDEGSLLPLLPVERGDVELHAQRLGIGAGGSGGQQHGGEGGAAHLFLFPRLFCEKRSALRVGPTSARVTVAGAVDGHCREEAGEAVIAPDETVDETGLLAPTGGAPREFG